MSEVSRTHGRFGGDITLKTRSGTLGYVVRAIDDDIARLLLVLHHG